MLKSIQRWRQTGRARLELDYLLSNARPQDPLLARIEWLIEVFHWMRVPGSLAVQGLDYKSGQVQATRVRYMLHILEKNPEWKRSVAKTLRSILRNTSALDLFCVTGLPSESGFLSEAFDRIMEKVLPRPPHEHDLGELFSRLFSSEYDIRWLERLDQNVLADIWQLFRFAEDGNAGAVWKKVRIDMEDALLFLTGQVRAFGLVPKLRARMDPRPRMRDLPFFEVTFFAQLLLKDIARGDPVMIGESQERFRRVLNACRAQLDVAHDHLDEFGVSIAIVYQLDRIKALIRRVETLLEIVLGQTHDPKNIVKFLCSLILEANQRRSVRSLFTENLSLISMKIAERSADTGAHYITRTRREYSAMIRSASQGGAMTSLTALLKLIIETISIPSFVAGVVNSLNYSISFLSMYAVGATLATKQPSMTANALAAKMEGLDSQEARTSLVDEIVDIIRSQGAAILGNVSIVIPCAVAIGFGTYYLSGYSVMSEKHALETLDHQSIIGLTPVHAAFTGVLLWASSICAGWIDNWSVYRELPQAIGSSRRLKSFLGPSRLKRWVDGYQKHLAPWTSNIALGFLLGMMPKILSFLGIPLDVRHVTLATGVVSYSAVVLGVKVFSMPAFWLAVAGIVVIGALNLGVSFYLALLVALKARRIRAPMRDEIYIEVLARFKKHPTSFFSGSDDRTDHGALISGRSVRDGVHGD